ncbi:glycoside hydrolase family 13 protein [Quadrisphaera sp. INWT6]|uniref:glycoside hydrolase family 13 protein n=1 Tax=Quadrisphaera sp. INWT6 TaxID=2596917 RepID=UPI0018920FBF|nr:glycoside hydrolase family 13 protein [Quadrisphaera sp. INWT6]MBF5081591.1 glycoside hydrolase family 13 protein [Quadrisphaera sp. INWT6]
MTSSTRAWWRTAVVYQVLLRSFADGDGDGTGDLAGLRARLPHLAALGVDAIWVNPWYPSPMVDAGYDVADYRDVDPAYGTLGEAQAFVAEAHALGMRVLLDVVPNHTSDAHPWFRAALAGDEAARARYLFRPGRGDDGAEPPNDWDSSFRGPAWTRSTDPATGRPGDWYLHLFAPEQPDLDWSNPEVRAELLDVLRFWFDLGVDGFRVDVAHGLAKAAGLPDAEGADRRTQAHPGWDQDEVHDVYRAWRALADSYDPPRVFVAEAWVARRERLPLYVRPDELHAAFAFEPLHVAWREGPWRRVVERELAFSATSGAPSSWVLTNHDVVRQVTRYAREQPEEKGGNEWERARWPGSVPDLELGRWRARAAHLLVAALPGVLYVYLGEELGLPEVEDLPADARVDPIFHRSGGTDPGRDGSRVPLPWTGSEPVAGTWLPQPPGWGSLAAAVQEGDPASVLSLYRASLALRRSHWAAAGPLEWDDAPAGVLALHRSPAEGDDGGPLHSWTTFAEPVELPAGARVLLASRPELTGAGGGADAGGGAASPVVLPPDTTAWWRRTP